MALISCHECGNQISTQAKTCPQCGAKNKSREKTSKMSMAIGLLILGYLIYYFYEAELNPNIPTCESSHGRKVFEGTFNKGHYAQKNKLRVLEVTEQKEIASSANPEDRVCEVTFRLNNGRRETYIFSFEDKESGGYFVKAKPK
jgi:hypothetical protein